MRCSGGHHGAHRERDQAEAAQQRARARLRRASPAHQRDRDAGGGGRPDWLFIDMEHGAISMHEASQICLAALPTGVTPIVRICADALDEGTRCLDNGALGVVVPHVDTAERAQEIAQAFRYPPLGTRSWGGPPAAYGFAARQRRGAGRAQQGRAGGRDDREPARRCGNARAIAAVEGIDALLIGTSDLTAEMGISGQIGIRTSRGLREGRRRLPPARQGARHGRRLRPGATRAATSRAARGWSCPARTTTISWPARRRGRNCCAAVL